jgi:hypothetical protein
MMSAPMIEVARRESGVSRDYPYSINLNAYRLHNTRTAVLTLTLEPLSSCGFARVIIAITNGSKSSFCEGSEAYQGINSNVPAIDRRDSLRDSVPRVHDGGERTLDVYQCPHRE